MDQQRQQLFDPLKATLMSLPLTLADFLDTIASFLPGEPHVAYAFCRHASEYMSEQPAGDYEIRDLICETYRRAFFDPETAAKYGTDRLANDLVMLKAFSEFMVVSFAMDKAQTDSHNYHDTPNKQQ